jgi:sigma-B regulation protein RsbU (phosphoserine phosphatase)
MASVDTKLLQELPVFREAAPELLEGLAQAAVERRFEPGQAIVQEGTAGHEMYLVIEGAIEVVKGEGADEIMLATRGAGELIGEMSLIDSGLRSATVRALEPTLALEFSEQDLRTVWAQQPLLLYQILQTLTSRLRAADLHIIEDLKRKNRELANAYHELQQAQAALVEKERLERELELARDLQQSMLPSTFPRIPGLTCAARSRPARQVGGDFYDVIPLTQGRVGLIIADVSDKGIAAALYMALTRSLVRAEAKRSFSPRQVLLRTHKLLLEMRGSQVAQGRLKHVSAGMFFTAFYAVLDLERGTLRYARAGHEFPLLVNLETRECRTLDARGMLLGSIENVLLEEVTVPIRPGEVLVLYTDGITEATARDGEWFGEERLREAVCHLSFSQEGTFRRPNAQDLCDHIFQVADQFQDGAIQHDDMALLVVSCQSLNTSTP